MSRTTGHFSPALRGAPAAPVRAGIDAGESDGPIDHDHRRRLAAELGDELVEELTGIFWTDAENLSAGIAEAFAGGDVAGLRRLLHTLEGAASNVGFVGMVAVAAEILRSREPPTAEAIARLSAMTIRTRQITVDREICVATQQEKVAPQRGSR